MQEPKTLTPALSRGERERVVLASIIGSFSHWEKVAEDRGRMRGKSLVSPAGGEDPHRARPSHRECQKRENRIGK